MKVLFTFIALWLCFGGVKVYAQTYIGTEAELRAFAAAVNNPDPDKAKTYEGEYIYLIADIPLGSLWTPIGTDADHPFKGHFEGWGHKITNLAIDVEADNVGFFGIIDGGSVRDLGVEGDLGAEGNTIKGFKYVGGICGKFIAGEISSCYSSIAVSGTQYVGGLCGQSSGVIRNCWHEGNIAGSEDTGVYAGGLVGLASGTLQHCYVINTQITVPNLSGTSLNSYFGLIVGDWKGNPSSDPLECCIYNTKDVTVKDFNLGSVKEIIVGSQSGDQSPTLQSTVKGASPEEMKSEKNGVYDYTLFWNDNDNDNVDDDLLNEYAEEISKNNEVWHIEQGYYPQLNSFYSKNKKITFNFTSTKQWLTIVPNGNYNVPAGVTAYQVTKIDGSTTEGGTVTLTPVSALYEGCPAIVHSTAGTPIETDGTISGLNSEGYSAWQGNNLLQGSPTSPDHIAEDEDATNYTSGGTSPAYTCYILQNGEFCIVHAGTMARGKAYLKIKTADDEDVDPNSGGKFRLVFQNEEEKPTNILSVDNSLLPDDSWYTLDGRKLEGEPIENGVYIVNGKKVIIQ